jgi:hypothetical protein
MNIDVSVVSWAQILKWHEWRCVSGIISLDIKMAWSASQTCQDLIQLSRVLMIMDYTVLYTYPSPTLASSDCLSLLVRLSWRREHICLQRLCVLVMVPQVQTVRNTKTHIIHECHNIFRTTVIISMDVPHDEIWCRFLIVQVLIKDEAGREKLTTQPFSLDGSRLSFRLLPRLALMSNISLMVRNQTTTWLHTEWFCHFPVSSLFRTSLGIVMSSSYSLWHNIILLHNLIYILALIFRYWEHHPSSQTAQFRDICHILLNKRAWNVWHSDLCGICFRKDVLYLWTVSHVVFGSVQ